MPRKIRRLVTGHDKDGKSIFLMDGDAESVLVLEQMGGLAATDLWKTFDAPADNSGDVDNAARPVHLEPKPKGTIFRTVEFPPDSTWKKVGEEGMDARNVFVTLDAAHAADSEAADPSMHTTASVDYAMVIKGEIWAVLDKDERLMREGDVLIQRGTNHGWSNRSDENCLMMFVLCGATPI